MTIFNVPVATILKLGKPENDKVEWDLYFNTLTNPDWSYDPEAPTEEGLYNVMTHEYHENSL